MLLADLAGIKGPVHNATGNPQANPSTPQWKTSYSTTKHKLALTP